MTTTPDSRIRADFGVGDDRLLHDPLGYYAKRDAAKPIDTSTTAGKISVMNAAARGESVQQRAIAPFVNTTNCDWMAHDGEWNWGAYDYRIAPPPAPRSALQAARDYDRKVPPIGGRPDDKLRDLLKQIDYAPVVEVLERRISWDAADLSALPKGRYRLLRDDA